MENGKDRAMRLAVAGEVTMESLVHGDLFVADTEAARANKAILEEHFRAEWVDDIEATMKTIHPDDPWQRIPGLGIEVRGHDAVRDYYLGRFENWPGPAMDPFWRATFTDHVAHVEGKLHVEPRGEFGGREVAGAKIECASVIVIDFRDGLIVGETAYLDTAKVLGLNGPDA